MQDVTIEAGETYTLSAYVKTQEENLKKGKCQASIIASGSFGTILADDYDYYQTENGWYRLMTSISIPEGETVSSASVSIGVKGVAQGYFDCFQFVKAASASRYNLIENGDFSNGTTAFSSETTNIFDKVIENGPDTETGGEVKKYQYGVVTEPVLNLRSGPGTSYSVVGTAEVDTKVLVLEETAEANGTKWYFVYFLYNEQIYVGYMAGAYIRLTEGSYEYPSTAVVDVANLNIRRSKGTSGDIIVTVPRNTEVEVIGSERLSNGQYWYIVYFSYGGTKHIGYAFAEYIYDGYHGTTFDWDGLGVLDNHIYQMVGNPSVAKKLTQTILINGKAGDVYMGNVWGTGHPVAEKDNRAFGLEVEFEAADGTKKSSVSTFQSSTAEWQFLSDVFVAETDYVKIHVSCVYNYNCNAVAFDGLALYREDFSQSFLYDEDGNVQSVTNNAKQKSEFTYSNNDDLINMQDPAGNDFTYEYDSRHNVTEAVSATEMKYEFEYDEYGNPKKTKVVDETNNKAITSTAEYDATYHAYQTAVTDALGNTTRNTYEGDRYLLTKSTDPNGNVTEYAYDDLERLVGVETEVSSLSAAQTAQVTYSYENDSLASITHNGFTYAFEEDAFGNNTGVYVAGTKLVGRTYESNNGNLATETYANGCTYLYSYDEVDRLIEICMKDSEDKEYVLYRYEYDNEGNLAVEYDIREDLNKGTIVTRYFYDISGRLINTSIDGEENYRYEYDLNNNLIKNVQKNEYREFATEYTYDEDSREKETKTPGGKTYSTTYDKLGRIESQTWDFWNNFSTTYTYRNNASGGSTNQVEKVTVGGENGIETTYTYDANGNITCIQSVDTNIRYEYDELNQLVREDNSILDKTILYGYDVGGNLSYKYEYEYQPSVDEESILNTMPEDAALYEYDPVWKDKLIGYDDDLTAINPETITYDAIGNPLSYRGMTFTWEKARELGSVTKDGVTYEYRYDQDGMRNRKYLADATVYYQMDGDLIVGEQKVYNDQTEPAYEMEFIYDSAGNIIALLYNGTEYYYEKNMQGDIVAIRNAFGEQSVTYTYDTWGNVIDIGGLASDRTLGELNPFRYRGYYYDSETGLYYLRSRYYDPEIGRFLNSDSQLNVGFGVIGCNLFAYCGNNPINMIDPSGHAFMWITAVIGAAAGAIAGGYLAASHGGNILVGAGIGAAAGALVGLGIGAAAGVLFAGGATASTSAVVSGATVFWGTVSTGGIGAGVVSLVNNVVNSSNGNIQTTTNVAQTGQNVYYQVTSSQAAQEIINTGKLIPSGIERSVCVLDFQPTLNQAKQLGANAYETVIRFSTNCSTFVPDQTVPFRGAFRNLVDGAIVIFDIMEVGFK